jgi:hypothetical protein
MIEELANGQTIDISVSKNNQTHYCYEHSHSLALLLLLQHNNATGGLVFSLAYMLWRERADVSGL